MAHYLPAWQQQSPIALDTGSSVPVTFPMDYLVVNYPREELHGHFCQHNFWFDDPPFMSLDGQAATLMRLHIHAPAEHMVFDVVHDFEMHFVNELVDQTGDSKAVVIGTFFKEMPGAPTPVSIRALNKALQGRARDEETEATVNPWNFLPTNLGPFFRYEGSLTTPAYDQVVSWVVMPTPVLVDPEDVRALKEHAEEDARKLQKLQRRFVLRSFT
jgi:carbonic anhydrase